MERDRYFDEIGEVMKRIDRKREELAKQFQLTRNELMVLSFLIDHPHHDTAGDIVVLRRLPKANVSQAVESLLVKGYIERTRDLRDRRIQHLLLTPTVKPLAKELHHLRSKILTQLFSGFSDEERAQYAALNRRLVKNAFAMNEGSVIESNT